MATGQAPYLADETDHRLRKSQIIRPGWTSLMDGLERIWATWRHEYVSGETGEISRASDGDCVLCWVVGLRTGQPEKLVYCGESAAVILNAYPYNTGHVMVLPYDHVSNFEDLKQEVRMEIFDLVTRSISAVERSYGPDGINMGANIGRGAGAGADAARARPGARDRDARDHAPAPPRRRRRVVVGPPVEAPRGGDVLS